MHLMTFWAVLQDLGTTPPQYLITKITKMYLALVQPRGHQVHYVPIP